MPKTIKHPLKTVKNHQNPSKEHTQKACLKPNQPKRALHKPEAIPRVSKTMGIKEPGWMSCIDARRPNIKQGTKKPTDWKTWQSDSCPSLRVVAYHRPTLKRGNLMLLHFWGQTKLFLLQTFLSYKPRNQPFYPPRSPPKPLAFRTVVNDIPSPCSRSAAVPAAAATATAQTLGITVSSELPVRS